MMVGLHSDVVVLELLTLLEATANPYSVSEPN